MDDRFYTAFTPSEATVCGRKLTNFSAFHFLLLSAIKSPFFEEQGEIKPSDLVAAVRCCLNKFGDYDLFPTWKDWLWRKRMERNPSLFKEQCIAFHQFLNAHSCGPIYWQSTEGGQALRELTGPAALIPIVASMRDLHFTEEQAWNMSLGRLQWYNAESSELSGSERRFIDQNELDAHDKALAEMEAGNA